MKSLRIVFMGSPEFAVPSLEKIYHSSHQIAAVASNPDKRRGRRRKPEPTAVKQKALDFQLPVIDVEDVHSESFKEQLKALNADLFVVVAFRILPDSLLELPKIGSVNLHASLLPKYRGAAPIHWAVINGEKETGCTVFFLDKQVDTGDIISSVSTEITPHETTGELYNRLKAKGADLLADTVDQIARGGFKTHGQDHSQATPAPKLFRVNTRIDFHKSSGEVHNFVRGLNPFPGAWCMYEDQKMNIHKTMPAHGTKDIQPGELVFENNQLYAGCGQGAVEVLELQLPGRKRIGGADFANGYDTSIRLI